MLQGCSLTGGRGLAIHRLWLPLLLAFERVTPGQQLRLHSTPNPSHTLHNHQRPKWEVVSVAECHDKMGCGGCQLTRFRCILPKPGLCSRGGGVPQGSHNPLPHAFACPPTNCNRPSNRQTLPPTALRVTCNRHCNCPWDPLNPPPPRLSKGLSQTPRGSLQEGYQAVVMVGGIWQGLLRGFEGARKECWNGGGGRLRTLLTGGPSCSQKWEVFPKPVECLAKNNWLPGIAPWAIKMGAKAHPFQVDAFWTWSPGGNRMAVAPPSDANAVHVTHHCLRCFVCINHPWKRTMRRYREHRAMQT